MGSKEGQVLARDFKDIDIFYNPASTSAQETLAHVRKRFDKWEGGPRVQYHVTSANIDYFKEIVIEAIEAKDGETITGAISGDGSINSHLLIKQDPETPEIVRNSPLWTPGGGNAINLFKAVTDRLYYRHPEEVIKHGVIEEFYPLAIETTDQNGNSEERLAASIFSVGAMALAAEFLNDPNYRSNSLRNKRFGEILTDPIRVLQSLKYADEFTYKDSSDQTRELFDFLFINAPHIAKVIHATEVSLTGPAYMLEVPKKNSLKVVKSIAKLAIGRGEGEFLKESANFEVISDGVIAQVDGESWYVDPNTKFNVGYSKTPIKIVSTIKNP